MSVQSKLTPGQTVAYWTRPVGLSTTLFLRGGEGEGKAVWHIELCCQPDHEVALEAGQPSTVDISSAKGAAVSVRNAGFDTITVWTDYIDM